MALPVIDVSPLLHEGADRKPVADALREACRTFGFFYASGHGIASALIRDLDTQARAFFALPESEKLRIEMARGGRAWRGYFPVGAELTSGEPDQKEGIYFGADLSPDDPRVLAKTPLHGSNLFPESVPELRATVTTYMHAMTSLGHALMEGIAASLDLPSHYFRASLSRDPLTLFRIFRYPAASQKNTWGVGEHTDYGLLTLLLQDNVAGLEVRTPLGWIDAPPIDGTFVCNLGDMIERMTGGRYLSTPHRVRSAPHHDRLSFPFFFDPSWDAPLHPVVPGPAYEEVKRWDGQSVFDLKGTYGEYLLSKVSRVFPELGGQVF
jgi:isopenicillin N synthase-like dioxygenase